MIIEKACYYLLLFKATRSLLIAFRIQDFYKLLFYEIVQWVECNIIQC